MKKITATLIMILCSLSIYVIAPAEYEAGETDENDAAVTYAPLIADDAVFDGNFEANEPRLADGKQGIGNIENPDKFWAQNGYPSDISFAFEAGGEVLANGNAVSWWIIGIVNADETRKQEIVNLLSPDCVITFQNCNFSYNEREKAYNEILASNDANIRGAVMILNSENVFVEVAEPYEKEYAARFIRQYGSFVGVTNNIVAMDDAVAVMGGNGLDEGGGDVKKNSVWIWAVTAIFLVGAMSLIFVNRSRLVPVPQTTKGGVFANAAPIGKRGTVAAIKNDAQTPSDNVFAAVLREIDDEKE